MPEASVEALTTYLHRELTRRSRHLGTQVPFEAVKERLSEVGITYWSFKGLESCRDAEVAISFEVLLTTFILNFSDELLRVGIHLPEGFDSAGEDEAPELELYVVGECPRCDQATLLLPELEDEFSAGLALEAGRAWEWHDCLPDGDDG